MYLIGLVLLVMLGVSALQFVPWPSEYRPLQPGEYEINHNPASVVPVKPSLAEQLVAIQSEQAKRADQINEMEEKLALQLKKMREEEPWRHWKKEEWIDQTSLSDKARRGPRRLYSGEGIGFMTDSELDDYAACMAKVDLRLARLRAEQERVGG